MPTGVTQNTLNTRIKLRYDTYDNWMAVNPLLKEGEVAIAYVPVYNIDTDPKDPKHNYNENNELTTKEPAILIKVGTGAEGTVVLTSGEEVPASSFKALPFIQAKAADVYDWAKKSTGQATDISFTPSDPNGNPLTSVSVAEQLQNLIERLNTVEGGTSGGNGPTLASLQRAINTLNDTVNTEGSVLYKIRQVTGDVPADTTLQAQIDILNNVGAEEGEYLEGSVAGMVQSTNANIRTRLNTLIGEDENISAREIAADVVAGVVDNAPTAFDTLKEIADWISTAGDNSQTAADMITDINSLKTHTGLGTLTIPQRDQNGNIQYDPNTEEELTQTATVKQYVDEHIDTARQERISLRTRVSALENTINVDCLILDCGKADTWEEPEEEPVQP